MNVPSLMGIQTIGHVPRREAGFSFTTAALAVGIQPQGFGPNTMQAPGLGSSACGSLEFETIDRKGAISSLSIVSVCTEQTTLSALGHLQLPVNTSPPMHMPGCRMRSPLWGLGHHGAGCSFL